MVKFQYGAMRSYNDTISTHRDRVMHICVSKLTIIGLHNGLLPGRGQAIIYNSAEILLIGAFGTNFNEILIRIHIMLFKKMPLGMSPGNCQPFCVDLDVLIDDRLLRKIWIHELHRFEDANWRYLDFAVLQPKLCIHCYKKFPGTE